MRRVTFASDDGEDPMRSLDNVKLVASDRIG
jgi:hypothetical protein